jgi:hypothetical protein
MKILSDIQALFYSLHAKKTAAEISRTFNRERKWLYRKQWGESFVVDSDFIAGLYSLGYELVLKKRED